MGNSRGFHHACALAALVFLTQPAFAKAPQQPPEPAEHPPWAEASRQGIGQLLKQFYETGARTRFRLPEFAP